MKNVVYALCGYILLVGCDVNQLDFDNVQNPTIKSTVAVPLGTLQFTLQELIEQTGDSVVSIEIEEESTLISLVYTDSFSFQASDEIISISDITNSANVFLPATPTTPVSLSVPFEESFSFTYNSDNGEQLDSIIYESGTLSIDVSSTLAPTLNYVITIPNTLDRSRNPVVINGTVSGGTNNQTVDLTGYKSFFSFDGADNSFEMTFAGTVNLSAGQSINAGDNFDFTIGFQNQAIDVVYGYFGQDTLSLGNQTLNVDFFSTLSGDNGIEFENPQINVNFRNSIGLPVGIDFTQVRGADDDGLGNLSNEVSLSGAVTQSPQLIGSPTTAQIGESIESSVGLNAINSNFAQLLASAPNTIQFEISGITNPPGSSQQNFFHPDFLAVEADVEVRLPLIMSISDISRSETFGLGSIEEITEADSIVLRVYSSNLLPLNTDLTFEILDDADSVIYNVPETRVISSAFLNTNFIASVPRIQVSNIALDAAGIQALTDGSQIRLQLVLNTPPSINSTAIFPKFLARYSLDISVSVLARLNLDI